MTAPSPGCLILPPYGAGRKRRGRQARWQPGFDCGKKIKGKERHVLVDTQCLLMEATAYAAGIQDRDGGVMLAASLFGRYPVLLKL